MTDVDPVLSRIFTLDLPRTDIPMFAHHELRRFAVSTRDAILAQIGDCIYAFSISRFPEVEEDSLAGPYIQDFAFDSQSGLLFVASTDSSGNAPIRLIDFAHEDDGRPKTLWSTTNLPVRVRERSNGDDPFFPYWDRGVVVPYRMQAGLHAALDPLNGCFFVGGIASKRLLFAKFSRTGDLLREVVDFCPEASLLRHEPSRVIAAAGSDLVVMDAHTLDVIARKKLSDGRIESIAAGTDGATMVVITQAGEVVGVDEGLNRVWARELDCLPRAVRFEPESARVFVGTNLGDVLVFRSDGALCSHDRVSESVRDFAFLHGGRHVLVGCKNLDFHLFVNRTVNDGAGARWVDWEHRLSEKSGSAYTTTGRAPRSRIFVSYASADEEFARHLESRLAAEGFVCWRDEHSLVSGRITKQLQRAITENDVVLVIISRHSIASDWVRWELDSARALEKATGRDIICPVAIDDTWKDWEGDPVLKREIVKYHILSFDKEKVNDEAFDSTFAKLVSGIRQNYTTIGQADDRAGRGRRS